MEDEWLTLLTQTFSLLCDMCSMCPFLFTTVSWGNLSNYQQLQYVQKREEEKYVYKKNQT